MTSTEPHRPPPPASLRRPRRWWRRPWVAPLVVVTVAFVAFSLPPYATLDPQRSRIPSPEGFPWYYGVLVGHVVFGSVAILTCCLQVWPWFRARFPAAHRWVGRVYVLGGVVPAGAMGLAIGVVSPAGPTLAASGTLLALLWLGVTLQGFRRARQRRFHDHRRWMIRSFALTMSIITNRITGFVWIVALLPELPTTYAGSMDGLVRTAASTAAWTGWMGSLLVAEWWLHRDSRAVRTGGRPSTPGGSHRLGEPVEAGGALAPGNR